MEVPAEIAKTIINEEIDQQIIVIKELDGTRSFPIVIGINEILAIVKPAHQSAFHVIT